jgi:predicted 3-demethylubiquinone-9 3-methyltransferase (glyoxalase superfamily)
MPTITPFLWFDDTAEEAIELYSSLFPDATVSDEQRNPDGSLRMATFRIAGQSFMALNGGPHFTFTEAISLFVSVQTQEEVDHLWDALTADGGTPSQCGWLKDRFGLSWQIVPTILGELLSDPDPAKAGRALQAMLQMAKLDIAALRAAHAGT